MANIKFTLLREATDEDKIAKTKQVKVILKNMIVGQVVARADLVEKVDADPEFESRQGASKVINFYQPKLIAAGLIKKETEVEANEAKAEGEKPAKKPKAKKSGEAKAPESEPELEGEEVDA